MNSGDSDQHVPLVDQPLSLGGSELVVVEAPAESTSSLEPSDEIVAPNKPLSPDTRYRVKLYVLDPLSQSWLDRGTGNVVICYVELKDAYCLALRSEEDGRVLLDSPIQRDDVYQRQEDTLIVWTETDGTDFALSFQDIQGCLDIWENINDLQRRLQSMADIRPSTDDDVLRELDEEPSFDSNFEIPPMELSNLSELVEKLSLLMRSAAGRDRLVNVVLHEQYISKLCELFQIAEDMDMRPEILIIFNIMKLILMSNEQVIFEQLLADDIIVNICGIFEYDTEYIIPPRKYRDFISDPTRYRKIAEFSDPTLECKIHQTFRAQYLKDVVLARIIEEAHFSVISSIIIFNQADILNALSKDQTFLLNIFSDLRASTTTRERKVNILLFIQDFCNIGKNAQMANRQTFYRSLASNGIFQELPQFFQDPDYSVRLVVTDIFLSILDHDASLLRSFILVQNKHGSRALSQVIIDNMFEDPDSGMKNQYAEILKLLLDWTNMDTSEDQDNKEFLHYFYSENFSSLVKPVTELQLSNVSLNGHQTDVLDLTTEKITICTLVVELLCYLIRMHTHRIKFSLLSGDILQKVSFLALSPNPCVKLVGIRLFRTLIGIKDEFFNRFIVKHNLLSRVFAAFDANGSKYNLLNSVVLEMLEFIRAENIKSLIKYIAENFWKSLESIDYVPTGDKFMLRYEQNTEILNDVQKHIPVEQLREAQQPGRGWGKVDTDEEAYFNDDDDNQDNQAPPADDDTENLPFIRRRPESDDEDDFTSRLKPGKQFSEKQPSLPQTISFTSSLNTSASSLPSPLRRKGYGLVDYPDEGEDSDDSSECVPSSPSASPAPSNSSSKRPASPGSPRRNFGSPTTTPTKIRSLTIGAKRLALDDPSSNPDVPSIKAFTSETAAKINLLKSLETIDESSGGALTNSSSTKSTLTSTSVCKSSDDPPRPSE